MYPKRHMLLKLFGSRFAVSAVFPAVLGRGILDDGRKVTADMVRAMVPEELVKVKATVVGLGEDVATYEQAAVIFERMSLAPDYPEFLTLPLYEAMA